MLLFFYSSIYISLPFSLSLFLQGGTFTWAESHGGKCDIRETSGLVLMPYVTA